MKRKSLIRIYKEEINEELLLSAPEKGAQVVIQPYERSSGIDLSIDAKKLGNKPATQHNPVSTVSGAAETVEKISGLVGSILR